MNLDEAAELLAVKPEAIADLLDLPAGTVITTTDGVLYIATPDGLMYYRHPLAGRREPPLPSLPLPLYIAPEPEPEAELEDAEPEPEPAEFDEYPDQTELDDDDDEPADEPPPLLAGMTRAELDGEARRRGANPADFRTKGELLAELQKG